MTHFNIKCNISCSIFFRVAVCGDKCEKLEQNFVWVHHPREQHILH
jgi:hypothetical protein